MIPNLADADLKLLRVFRTVTDCGGFAAAEVVLNISRAAISQHMADLEKRLGLRLCRRGRAGFLLTEDGRAVYEASDRLLAAAENFRAEINALHATLRGDLTIGITDNLVTSPRMTVTNALRRLKTQAPDVRINIRMMPPSDIQRGVLDGRLHVGVVPSGRSLPSLNTLPLYDEDWLLYCSHDHPLFAVPDTHLTPQRIEQADAVASAEHPASLSTSTATATDREGVAFLILTGCYIGFLPTHYARQWQERGQMKPLLPAYYRQTTQYQAITQANSPANLVRDSFLTLLGQ